MDENKSLTLTRRANPARELDEFVIDLKSVRVPANMRLVTNADQLAQRKTTTSRKSKQTRSNCTKLTRQLRILDTDRAKPAITATDVVEAFASELQQQQQRKQQQVGRKRQQRSKNDKINWAKTTTSKSGPCRRRRCRVTRMDTSPRSSLSLSSSSSGSEGRKAISSDSDDQNSDTNPLLQIKRREIDF